MSEEKILKIKEKIKNLLALGSNNSSQQEALSALTKARELMIKYNLEDKDIKENKEENITYIRTDISLKLNWKKIVAVNLSKYLKVKVTNYNGYMEIFGYEEDAKMAELFIKNIMETANKLSNKYIKDRNLSNYSNKYKNACKNDFIFSFVEGIIEIWETQNKQFSNSLVVLISKEVQEAYEDRSKSYKKRSVNVNSTNNQSVINSGKQAGRDFINKNAILN
jgi:hypothetical protein